MKKVLVVDWLDKYGGAERVITALQKAANFDHLYALVNVMQPDDLKKISPTPLKVTTTYLNRFGTAFRTMFFLMHHAVETIKVPEEVDLIVSSSHAVAKGVKKSAKHQVHISYFQARNFKYIWDDQFLYFGRATILLQPLIRFLQRKDVKQAQAPDYIIVNSNYVKKWVEDRYKRIAKVIYPPVNLQAFPLEVQKEDYYVAVGRLVAYKHFDVIVKAFVQSGKKLVLVGDGAQMKALKFMATDNIIFTGFVSEHKVYEYISKAKAFIHAGIEDFGIAAVEAQSCGTPVITFEEGGMLETIISEKTGLFFKERTPEMLNQCIEKFENYTFDYALIHQHAQQFSEAQFHDKMQQYISEVMKK
ncbi:glycosyltransferase [Myroides ceti]|uniref:Glycosyltransferase n=1 Tax=Paenimyroides ceti TaxID=395087 RepID=A0ABT8CWR6_9FLAO|nr:glycosyltransferase [Paenimyroides ceti]MDN3708551.1 glycosyltransferase [Paenimyroides ceti]